MCVCRYVTGRVKSVEPVASYRVEFEDGSLCSDITSADIVEVLPPPTHHTHYTPTHTTHTNRALLL